jgi:hypothetical protein
VLLTVLEALLKLRFFNCQQMLRCIMPYSLHVIKRFAFQVSQFQGTEKKSRGAVSDE